jgi:peptide deformylase
MPRRDDVNDHVRQLLDDLADTMKAAKGTSIAANQVGVMRRLIVVDDGSGVRRLVNPVIAEKSGAQECRESCISFKDIHAVMARPEKIVLEALDENGARVTVTAEGDAVKHYCHALDLLDGRIFIKEVIRFVDMPLEGE